MLSRIFVCEGKSGDYQKYLKQCTSIELRSCTLQVRWASSQLGPVCESLRLHGWCRRHLGEELHFEGAGAPGGALKGL